MGLGACSKINYVRLRAIGGWIKATLQSDQGTAILYAEPELEIRSDTNKYTALTIQRQPGVQVTVHVFLGDKA